jgi:hypothetical protein
MSRKAVLATSCCVAILLLPEISHGQTSTRVTVESTSAYSACGYSNLPNSIANGDNFRYMMLEPGVYTAGLRYVDSSVWDTDFVDPDVPPASGWDDDDGNFDRSGDAIAYYTGHGYCNASKSPRQYCTSTSQCTTPGPGQSLPGSCQTSPNVNGLNGYAECRYYSERYLITCGYHNSYGNWDDYSGGRVKFGESSHSGSWAGAGTNGGVNLVVLDISCGAVPNFGQELWPAFAGMHLFNTIMPIDGDTANTADRGATFGALYQANPNQAVATTWMETLNWLAACGSSYCSCGALPNGGHGINGCGANLAYAKDTTYSSASWHINYEDWGWLKSDGADADGNAWYAYNYICNYDCDAYPFIVP